MKVGAPHIRAQVVKRYGTALTFAVWIAVLWSPASGQRRATIPVSPYDGLLVSAARRYGLDLYILRAQMNQESGFKPSAVSPKGARGLMQLMPGTAARFGVTNIFDPLQNIEAGARYMRWLLDAFGGDYTLALAGYNAGEGAVMKYGRRVPPYNETQNYVAAILRTAMQYRASAGSPVPTIAVARIGRYAPVGTGTSTVFRAGSSVDESVGQAPTVVPASRYFFQ